MGMCLCVAPHASTPVSVMLRSLAKAVDGANAKGEGIALLQAPAVTEYFENGTAALSE